MDTTTAPKPAAIYTRISSDPSGLAAGVERQLRDCEQLAERLGLDVVDVYTDNDTSAYSGVPRPDFERLLSDAVDGRFAVIVAWAVDRIYRQPRDLERIVDTLDTSRVSVATVTSGAIDLSTPEGRAYARIGGAMAAQESERKAARITSRAQQRAMTEKRTVTAARPFGFRWADPCPGDATCRHKTRCTDGQRPRTGSRAGLVLHPAEAAGLAQAFRDVASGVSLYQAHRTLSATVPVGRMTPSTLGTILRRPRYAGLATYKGEITGDAADGLRVVDRGLWDRVQSVLSDPARRTSPGTKPRTMLGGGLLRCGKCGGPMASSNRSTSGPPAPVYICSRHQCMSRRRHRLDPPVLATAADMLAALADSGLLAVAPEPDDATTALRERIRSAEDRLDQLASLASTGDLSPLDFAAAAKRIRADMDDAAAKLTRRAGRPAVAKLTAEPDVRAAWRHLIDTGDSDAVRAVLAELLESITADTDGAMTLHWRDWTGQPDDRLTPSGALLPDRDTRRADVARLHADGLNVSQIARTLRIARATVRGDLAAAAPAQ